MDLPAVARVARFLLVAEGIGTRREVDRLGNFLDFGGQLSTGIVL